MPYKKAETFESKFGEEVARKGFIQVPNVLLRNLYIFGLIPVDLAVILYLWGRGKNLYTAVSFISAAIGRHPNTIRSSLRRLQKLNYVKRIAVKGEANKFDLTGLEIAIRRYTKTGITPVHNLYEGVDRNVTNKSQKLDTNKEVKIKELEQLKRKVFPNINKKRL